MQVTNTSTNYSKYIKQQYNIIIKKKKKKTRAVLRQELL